MYSLEIMLNNGAKIQSQCVCNEVRANVWAAAGQPELSGEIPTRNEGRSRPVPLHHVVGIKLPTLHVGSTR